MIKNKVSCPCIVKPVISSSGKGQSLINEKHDIQTAWEYVKSSGRVKSARVIVEQKIEFDYKLHYSRFARKIPTEDTL